MTMFVVVAVVIIVEVAHVFVGIVVVGILYFWVLSVLKHSDSGDTVTKRTNKYIDSAISV